MEQEQQNFIVDLEKKLWNSAEKLRSNPKLASGKSCCESLPRN